MSASSQFPADAATTVRIRQRATSIPFVFPARNSHARTATSRAASVIWIGHILGGYPAVPFIPLALAGPAAPSIPQAPGAGSGWAEPGQDRSGPWLRNAAVGLCVLAAAAAAVSFTASGDGWSTQLATCRW
jgi:hypothetical protein